MSKVFFQEHPGAPDLGSRNRATARELSQRFGMYAQERGGFFEPEGFQARLLVPSTRAQERVDAIGREPVPDCATLGAG